MKEADGNHAGAAVVSRKRGGELNEKLRQDEVGLKTGTERIAPPGHAGSFVSGSANKRVINDHADRFVVRQFSKDGAAH